MSDYKYKVGDLYTDGLPILPSDQKKKILLLADDLRMNSGIATMAKSLVFGTFHKYDWVQLGAAINHPEQGKEIDLGQDARDTTGIENASLKIIPWPGYGDPHILRQLMMRHRPDAIVHFTDPRYFRWLYEIESEIRENCPIMYYNIWDDLPLPMFNKCFYASCDGLFAISKQTYGINHNVLENGFNGEFEIITNKHSI